MLISSGKAFKCRKITTSNGVTAGKTTATTTITTTSKPSSSSSINNRSPPTTAFRSSPSKTNPVTVSTKSSWTSSRTGSANKITIPPDVDSNPNTSENTELPFVDSGAVLMVGTTITMIA